MAFPGLRSQRRRTGIQIPPPRIQTPPPKPPLVVVARTQIRIPIPMASRWAPPEVGPPQDEGRPVAAHRP